MKMFPFQNCWCFRIWIAKDDVNVALCDTSLKAEQEPLETLRPTRRIRNSDSDSSAGWCDDRILHM